jgi:hypothetical protein
MFYVRISMWKTMLNSEDWNGLDTSARWNAKEYQKERYVW